MRKTHSMHGTCSRTVSFDIDENNIISNIVFSGGCSGNLQGIAALCQNQPALKIVDILSGIRCGFKQTSCPDQFSKALLNEINKSEGKE